MATRRTSVKTNLWGLIFVAPAVAFFVVFSIFPILYGFYLSLTRYNLLTPPVWVGLDNFFALPRDFLFVKAFWNTIWFVIGTTIPVWFASLALAVLFDRKFPGREVLKAFVFLPVLPPLVVVGIVWMVLMHPNGVFTSLFGLFTGQSEIQWLTSVQLAPISMIIINNWATIPFFMVIWLAGLAGIPKDLSEAAQIDGANAWTTFWRVEFPLLRGTSVLVACLATINSFQAFG
ncbi:carbohydrate ABC transporter permease [Mesorhizobium muleiense]|uniref:carbohydrate ABC transporter permease n=1 Tax=Mesorhizobium muleiense TaxID=1004279 RepID=UPI001F3D3C28|nr:sugar ABC transporter permease [Mesorhizobium muleiense]MCF6108426.1 sugar ABC transporter permease [Mesorhizobium muleiense]